MKKVKPGKNWKEILFERENGDKYVGWYDLKSRTMRKEKYIM